MPRIRQFRCAKLVIHVDVSQLNEFKRRWNNLVIQKELKYIVGCPFNRSSGPRVCIKLIAQGREKISKKKFKTLLIPDIEKQDVMMLEQCIDDEQREETIKEFKGYVKHDSGEWSLSPDAHARFEFGRIGHEFTSRVESEAIDDSAIPDWLICPITQAIMNDAVMVVESGHSYDKLAITKWLRDHDKGT
jgi:hypothetical protein